MGQLVMTAPELAGSDQPVVGQRTQATIDFTQARAELLNEASLTGSGLTFGLAH